MSDPFYQTKAWRALREARLRLDRHTCVVPGCGQPATVVDHIRPRLQGGSDAPWNLRSLCKEHDNQIKERPGQAGKRVRGNKGRLVVRGCNPDGSPRDPTHPWYKAR